MVWDDMCCDRCLHPTYRQFGQFRAAKIVKVFDMDNFCHVFSWGLHQ